MTEPTTAFRRRHDDDERYLTRREAELLIANTMASEGERNAAHLREHQQDADAIDKALANEAREQQQHNLAHDKAHDAHEEKHKSEGEAVKTALAALDRERQIHATAHQHEHDGHHREHGLNNLAIDKAEAANDKRFTAVNGTREQIEVILRGLASKDTVEGLSNDHSRRWEELRKELDRRFDEANKVTQERFDANRTSITNLEKGDVKAEGKGLGQTATIAAIIGSITAASAILGFIIVVANLLTAHP